MFLRASLLALAASAAGLYGQSWREGYAQLCFVRPENNGAMNIVQSWVRVSDYEVPLIGGQAACIFLHPGTEDLVVTSKKPYEPESSDEEACKSRIVPVTLTAHENRTFFIWPAIKGSGYVCGWRIDPVRPPKKKAPTRKPTAH